MKNYIITIIGCVVVACAFVGCASATTSTARNDVQQPIAISIANDGTLSLVGEQCPPDELFARLRELAAKKTGAVEIQADKDTPFKQVVAVMDACKTAGLQQVSLRTIR